MSTARIAIIGAGYSGLSAAYELVKLGRRPVIFEAQHAAGGLAGCVRFGDTYLERFYHHWFNHDRDILQLVRELGLDRHVVRRQTTTGTLYAGRVHRLSSPLDVMRFKPLSMVDRCRLGRMVLRAAAIEDYQPLEGMTARQWITEMSSPAVYDVVWRPLLEGKFGRYADQLSAVWFWSKLRTRGRSRSRRQREELLYLEGGFQRLTQALLDAVTSNGGQVWLGCPVRRIQRTNGGWRVESRTGPECFDQVLVTTPTPIATELIEDLPDSYRRRAAAVPYLGVTELMLILNRSLSDTYWLNVNDPGYPFVGVIEHTNFQPPDVYGGRHVVYVTRYGDESHQTEHMDHQALFNRWRGALQQMFPAFEESCVELALSWQNPHAQPVVLAGREDQILPLETPLPGVWMCTMAQVYPEDRGTNYAVRLGRQTARRMVEVDLRRDRPQRILRSAWPAVAEQDDPAPVPVAALQGLSPA